MKTWISLCAVALMVLCGWVGRADAEVGEITVAQQWGIGYLPLMVMQQQGLIEKQAKAAGLNDLKVHWVKFAGSNVANDALLAGRLQFAAVGVPPLITMWAKTHGNLEVKGVAALDSMPFYLNTSNPNVKSIEDLTNKDRIALPAVKVSVQAVTLQMAAEKAFGPANVHKLDPLTVSMSHPQGLIELLGGKSGIDCHFTSPPFQYEELAHPGIHTLLNSYDVLGGPATFVVVWTTAKFRAENPKTYLAFLHAMKQAVDFINEHKSKAADVYLKMSNDKESKEAILKMLNDPQIQFSLTPNNTMKYADFMYKIGSIKIKPHSWKDLFFPEVHDLPGS
ncbi:MAG: ABC transporter substrate-binding protein [Betaproteobacteria bacterium]|nr:ABC transporter substrate-binding protein [Betaproteobacteria bacterium]